MGVDAGSNATVARNVINMVISLAVMRGRIFDIEFNFIFCSPGGFPADPIFSGCGSVSFCEC